jgi:hypothetical protein
VAVVHAKKGLCPYDSELMKLYGEVYQYGTHETVKSTSKYWKGDPFLGTLSSCPCCVEPASPLEEPRIVRRWQVNG